VTHLLDTDTLSVLQWPRSAENPVLVANINLRGPTNVGVSIVSLHEQVLGAHTRISSARTPAQMVRGYEMFNQILTDFARITVLPFDTPAADAYEQLKALNLRVGTMDLRIAAVALANNLVLVTRNVRDFGKVPGLATEDWTK
jgi:tRNA(fMet)-specific endonuclease VapC